MVPPADDDLIVHAEVIVLGHVTRIESHLDDTDNVWTYITIGVEDTLKGALPGPEVTLKERGGRVGDRLAWVFANPHFRVGERALVFLDQHDDGALRTFHYFLGKFTIVTDPGSGDLVAARGVPRNVTLLPRGAAAAGGPSPAAPGRRFEDFARRIREKAAEPRPPASGRLRRAMPFASATPPPSGTTQTHQEFRFLDDPDPPASVDPTATHIRWNEPDTNQPVVMRIYAEGEPLAPSLGFDQVRAAMRVWGRVPTSSFRFAEGPLITTPGEGGFLANGVSSIAFRDPQNEIPDPIGCSGVLAIAGIPHAEVPLTTVNGRTFFRAVEGDLVVADGWDACAGSFNGGYYQSFSNFAEVITHELGHVLGLGHSANTSLDAMNLGAGRYGATMRPIAAFDGRGAALHADDRAGVAFIYPGRTLSIVTTGPGAGTITSDTDGIACSSPTVGECTAGFAVNSTVTLTATSEDGSGFVGFLEAGCGTTVVMRQHRTCTAMFATRPDLQMTAVSAPTLATPGTEVTIHNTVRNNGLDAGPFNVGIYLSSTSTITTLSQRLATRRVASLAFNAQDTAATSVTVPANIPPGTYVIGAIADSDLEVSETLETNNTRIAAQPIVIGRADLVVTALSAPTTAGTGLTISASATVSNQAAINIPAPPSTLAFYLSTDATLDPGDTRLGQTRGVPLLARNASWTGTTLLTIPASQSAGPYFLIASADDPDLVEEQNEGNNTRATAMQITIRRPDLSVTSVTAPAVAAAGMNLSVTHVVRNVAAAPGNAGASTSSLFLSRDSALGDDVELGSVPVPPLAALTQASVTRSVQIPGGTPPGVYWIVAQANAPGAVIEADTPPTPGPPPRNNVRSTTSPTIVGPDLLVTAATPAPTASAPGRVVNVTSTVRNRGGAAAPPFAVGVYLSSNASFEASEDVLVGTRQVATGLAPAAASTAVTPVTIPAGTEAGTYFLIVRADDSGAVAEASEVNNARATVAVQVVKADLRVTSVTAAPTAVAAGMNVSVTHVVRNFAVAVGAAPASVSRLFLSSDPTLDGLDVQLGGDVTVAPLAGGAQVSLLRSVQIPPGTAPGRYWILARTNATGVVQEAPGGAQTNNVRATAMPVLVGPDLVPVAGTVTPAATAPGRTVNVTSTVRNRGGAATPPFQVGLVLSTDRAFDAGDIPLGSRSVASGLAPAATFTATTPLAIPGNLSAGAYFILVLADATDAGAEADETNNIRAIPLTLVRADLTVASVTATPGAVAPGADVRVTHVVRNTAPAAGVAGPTTSRLYLSTTPAVAPIDGAAVPLLDVRVGALAGMTQAAPVRSVRIPADTRPGRYWIIAEANATGAVTESQPDNNARATVTPIVVGPDLVVSAATVAPTATAPGLRVNVSHTVRNRGGQATGPFSVGVYLSTDNVLDGGDVLLASRTVAVGLAAGATAAAVTPVVLPGHLSSATHVLYVRADVAGDVTEADETNNGRTISLPVVRPDLTVSSITAPPTGAAGATISVTHVVRNLAVAAGAAPPSVSRLFLSADPTLDGAEIQLGADVVVGMLAGQGQASATRGVQIPPGTAPGRYFVLARADATGVVVESDEDNNTLFRSIVIGPDVAPTAVSTVAGAIPGATIRVTYTLRNLGGAAAGPFGVGFTLVPVVPAGPDIPMGPTRTAVVLAAGSALASSTPVVVPAGTTQGQYRVRVTTDVDDTVVEASESNNTAVTALVAITPPDLSMDALVVPAVGVAGRSIGIPDSVINTATPPLTSPAFQVGLYRSGDADVDPATDTLLASRAVSGLAPAVTSTATTMVRLLDTPGSYFLGAVADPVGIVIESDEDDNRLSAPIAVVPEMVRSRAATADLMTSGCINPVNDATLSQVAGT